MVLRAPKTAPRPRDDRHERDQEQQRAREPAGLVLMCFRSATALRLHLRVVADPAVEAAPSDAGSLSRTASARWSRPGAGTARPWRRDRPRSRSQPPPRGEDAHDLPVVALDRDGGAEVSPWIGPRSALPTMISSMPGWKDALRPSRSPRTSNARGVTADGDVGLETVATAGMRPHDDDLGRASGRPSEPTATRGSDHLVAMVEGTHDVSSRPIPLGDHGVARHAGGAQSLGEAAAHRHEGHEHRDHEADPIDGEQAHLPARTRCARCRKSEEPWRLGLPQHLRDAGAIGGEGGQQAGGETEEEGDGGPGRSRPGAGRSSGSR